MKKTTKPLPTFTAFKLSAFSEQMIYDLSTPDEKGDNLSADITGGDTSDLVFIQVDVSNKIAKNKTERDYYKRYSKTYHRFGDCNCGLDLASSKLMEYMKANYWKKR